MSKKPEKPVVGRRIRVARRYADLTLAEVGRRIGISNQALSAIERGKKNPSRQTLMNLARILRDDFGEDWLADYLGHQTESESVAAYQQSKFDKSNLMQLFEEFLDTKYKARQIKVGLEHIGNNVSIPVGYEILEDSFEKIDKVEEYIEVPLHMFPEGKSAIAGIVKSKNLREDAFIDEGDFVILTECPSSINGKTILALTMGEIVIKRCEVEGDKVLLKPFNENRKPIKIPVNSIVCLKEVTGMIRLVS